MNVLHRFSIAAGLALGLQSVVLAGPDPHASPSPSSNTGDWCGWLQDKPGLLYKNQENPYLQSFQIGGRFQYQAGFLDGEDVNGRNFNDPYDEYRRVRIESKTEFLQFFTAKVGINIVNDGRPSGTDLDWGYDTFDEANVSFDLKKAFGAGTLDSLKLSYGRFKFNITEEVRTSSKEIITIERSAIAGKVYNSGRPTGFTLDAAQGPWSGTAGIFSTEDDSEFIGGWNDGIAYYLAVVHEAGDGIVLSGDFVYNDRKAGDDDFLGYKWATSLNATCERGRFGILGTLVVGENNSAAANQGGNFYGLVAMPWYWIVDEKLQAVFQYSFSGAGEDAGIRTNSRYVRSQHSPGVNVNGGRGDALHTAYAGLNYHLCGHNAKIMGGIEYTSLDTPAGDVDALTYLIAFRSFF